MLIGGGILMKVLLFNIGRFAGAKAGTERVLCNMSNALVEKGYEVEILIYKNNMGEAPFPLDNRVKVIGAERGRLNLFERIRRSLFRDPVNRHEYEAEIIDKRRAPLIAPVIAESKPDVVICYQPGGTRILQAGVKLTCPVITMFHFNPEEIVSRSVKKTILALERCDKVQVLLESYIPALKKHINSDNVVYIPNVVPQFGEARANTSSKIIVHVGRFDEKQKRQHLMIEAFAKVADCYDEWTVEFWGDSDPRYPKYYEYCKGLVKKYGLQDRVRFCGTTNKVVEELQKASIFCFPSSFEGFPLAMTEAMSLGLPVIGYKNCPAVNELVVDGENGILCDDGVEPLAEALSELMKDEDKRRRYGAEARRNMEAYAPEVIWDMWDKLLQETVSEYSKQKKQ